VEQDSLAVVQSFINAINTHDTTHLYHLMTEDHLFVDAMGSTIRGREEMRKAWVAYFYLVPDYLIAVQEAFVKGDSVALFGLARGTCAEQGALHERNRWSLPAAWHAVIRNRQVAEWHVYADNEPVRQILASQERSV